VGEHGPMREIVEIVPVRVAEVRLDDDQLTAKTLSRKVAQETGESFRLPVFAVQSSCHFRTSYFALNC
jgi:hypothetical protein